MRIEIHIVDGASAWESYAQAAVPVTASDVQRKMMEQTFYAGMMIAIGLLDKLIQEMPAEKFLVEKHKLQKEVQTHLGTLLDLDLSQCPTTH